MRVYHRLGDSAAERRCDAGSMRPDVMLAAQCPLGDRGVHRRSAAATSIRMRYP